MDAENILFILSHTEEESIVNNLENESVDAVSASNTIEEATTKFLLFSANKEFNIIKNFKNISKNENSNENSNANEEELNNSESNSNEDFNATDDSNTSEGSNISAESNTIEKSNTNEEYNINKELEEYTPQGVDIDYINDFHACVQNELGTDSVLLAKHLKRYMLQNESKCKRKVAKYLQHYRSRLSPIPEVESIPEQCSQQARERMNNSMGWCVDDVEIFDSQTKIIKRVTVVNTPSQEEASVSLVECKSDSDTCDCSQHFNTSQEDSIELEKYGKLVNLSNIEIDKTMHIIQTRRKLSPVEPKKKRSRKFSPVMRWFRKKFNKKRKVKPKPRGVVYKTYFVRWLKPHDAVQNGFLRLRCCRTAPF